MISFRNHKAKKGENQLQKITARAKYSGGSSFNFFLENKISWFHLAQLWY
jgi:hypothetical protein